MATIHFDGERVLAALRRLEKACADQSPALLAIGEYLVESTKQRFVSGSGPDGTQWKENSDVTIERKGRDQPLVGEGTLMESIHYQLVGGNTLEIGSPMEYAATQQFGAQMGEYGRYYQLFRLQYGEDDFRRYAGMKQGHPIPWGNIPERPFLGISEEDETEILATIEEQLLSAI